MTRLLFCNKIKKIYVEVANGIAEIGARMQNTKPFEKKIIKRIEYVFIIVIRWTDFYLLK